METRSNSKSIQINSFFYIKKNSIILFLGMFALSLSGSIGEYSENLWNLNKQIRYGLQAIIMSGIVVTGVWYIRHRYIHGMPKSIGIGNLKNALLKTLLGIGLLLLPLFLTISSVFLFGGVDVNINFSSSTFINLLIGIGTVFLFEALPEELLFRGFIYSTLNAKFKRWFSALITIGLFVLLPIVLYPIQKYILGMETQIGNSSTLTISYIIIMLFFGAFVQYLRILTNSIWTGIGFHLMFVYFNRIMGPEPSNLIQFSNFTNERPLQIVFVTSLLIVFIVLLLYPRISKQPIGWNKTQQ